MSLFDSTKFKQLKSKWDKKLEKSGFRDIENAYGDLIDHRSTQDLWKRLGGHPENFEAIRGYFAWAEEMVLRGRFKSTADRKIWTLHSRGLTSSEIAESVPFCKRQVSRKIRKIRDYLIARPEKAVPVSKK